MPAKRVWLLFLVAAAIAYFYGLGNLPFIGADEPRYSQVAREMFERRDVVTPMLGGHTWFEKPALPYWVMMAGFQLFGVSEWSARLGFALMGLVTVWLIYWMGARTESAAGDDFRLLGLSSGVAAASSAGFLFFSHGVNFDTPLTLATTAALACFFVSELEMEKRRRLVLLAGFYAGTGAALIAKGLVGVIITFGVIAAYLLLRRAWPRREIFLSLLWGLPLMLAVASIWYAPVIRQHGWTFVDEFFIQHHFARYTSNKYHHPQPFYFYIAIMALLVLPWTPQLVDALWGARKWSWRSAEATSRFRDFALAWLVVPVLFFSASGSKLPGYILPALPGAVLLIGERLASTLRGEGRVLTLRAAGALMLWLAVGSVAYVTSEGYATIGCAITGAAPLVLGGLVALLWAGRRWLAVFALASAMFAMAIANMACGIEGIARRLSVAHALNEAATRGLVGTPVYQLHMVDRTAEYYAAGRLEYGPDGEPVKFEGVQQVRDAAERARGPVLVIVPSEFIEQLTSYTPLETEIIEDNGEVALVAAKLRR